MKLISLNTWNGLIFESLVQFIKDNSDTDIFCLQEVLNIAGEEKYDRWHLLTVMKKILMDHKVIYTPVAKGYNTDGSKLIKVDDVIEYGAAIFYKKSINVTDVGTVFITQSAQNSKINGYLDLPDYFQFIEFEHAKKNFIICNLHGVSLPGSKLDTPRRIRQSESILNFLKPKNMAKIVVGDFNLLPNTKSIHMFETSMKNLINF